MNITDVRTIDLVLAHQRLERQLAYHRKGERQTEWLLARVDSEIVRRAERAATAEGLVLTAMEKERV